MSIDEKVNYYYKAIIDRKNTIVGFNHVEYNEQKLKDALLSIVKTNKDHLLTPSFIYYLICNSDENTISEKLRVLTDENTSVFIYQDYLAHLYRNLPLFSSFINEYEKVIITEMSKYNSYQMQFENVRDFNHTSSKDLELLIDIVRIMAAYIMINNMSPVELDRYVRPYLDNLLGKVDEYLLQGIIREEDCLYTSRGIYLYVYENLIDYILGKMNDNQKEIR